MKVSARFEFKWQDLWIGAFLKGWYQALVVEEEDNPLDLGTYYDFFDIWICVVPCLPLHITLRKSPRHERI